MNLDAAAANYQAAHTAHTNAQQTRTQTHRAHLDTIPLVGRVHVGNGNPATRKAHHQAATIAAHTRRQLDNAHAQLAAAALTHNCNTRPLIDALQHIAEGECEQIGIPGFDECHRTQTDPTEWCDWCTATITLTTWSLKGES